MDGNQKLEGSRVGRIGGSNAKEETNMVGEKKIKRVGGKERRGRQEQRGRRRKIKHQLDSY